jgi:predicted HTH domain antitoxin
VQTTTVSTRLDLDELAQLDAVAERFGLDRSGMMKSLLRSGLSELSFKQAVEAYREGRITLSRASELASLSLWDFMARMEAVDLSFHYGVREFEEDLNAQF